MKIIVDDKEMEIEEPDNMFKQINGKWYAKVLNEKGIFATTLLNLLENNNIDNEIRELAKLIALENIELENKINNAINYINQEKRITYVYQRENLLEILGG